MIDVLFLTNNDNTLVLFDWLKEQVDVKLYREKLTIDVLLKYNPKLVISYNYKYIISEECISFMKSRIINLHISYLPWNKGASPNMWSFVDETPKGVTIHEMTKALDAGDIIVQKEVSFDYSKETLSSTYEKLHAEIVNLFIENWDDIWNGTFQKTKQIGKGSSHTLNDLRELKERVEFSWQDTIEEFLMKVKGTNG